MRYKNISWIVLTLWCFSLPGCKSKPEALKYSRPLRVGQHALRKITNPAELPDFRAGTYNLLGLRESIDNSLSYLSKPSSESFYPCCGITHARAVASLEAFAELLDSGLYGYSLADTIRQRFDVYTSVGCDDQGTVLFTGYYTPIFDGSDIPTERFRWPLYRQPDDLVKGDDGKILGRRLRSGRLVPYPSRREIITTGLLGGKELIWLADEFEAYVAHVQGSAKIRMPDGSLKGVGYAASNGHDYRSISHELVKDNKIAANKISLDTVIRYFQTHPEKITTYTSRNPRFVFFQKELGTPRGSLNEPVTDMRTIATDKSIFPRGCLTFISTRMPRESITGIKTQAYRGFFLDQDTGGAIRAPGRCDIYIGQGERAGQLAGKIYAKGKLYYLFLK